MHEKNTWKVNDNDPARATYEAVTQYTIRPPARELRLIAKFRMTSDEKNFYLTLTRELFEAKKLVREKRSGKRRFPAGTIDRTGAE
ncbi:MAG TPA: hypothetical protein P5046_06300 [Sphaerochaeta sp.]|nr:hypothetical protein [Sphaerochaeta sp.]